MTGMNIKFVFIWDKGNKDICYYGFNITINSAYSNWYLLDFVL